MILLLLRFNPTLVRLRPDFGVAKIIADTGFNPTLVRLRLGWAEGMCEDCLGFNPTLVRLRPKDDNHAPKTALQFQSHAGSIEATPVWRPSTPVPTVSIPRWFD